MLPVVTHSVGRFPAFGEEEAGLVPKSPTPSFLRVLERSPGSEGTMAASHSAKSRKGLVVTVCLVWLAALLARAQGDCSFPSPLNNTRLKEEYTSTSFPVGSTVTYACDDTRHYVQIPGKSDSITCLPDSTWSTIEEFCERSCNVPTKFAFAQLQDEFVNRNVFPVGTRVTYDCRPGYKQIQRRSRTIVCLDGLQWENIAEFCERKDCGSPGELVNGDVELKEDTDGTPDTKFGATATFHCNEGFRMVGRSTRLCVADRWTNAVPTCETIKCPGPPTIEGGTHSSMGQDEFGYLQGVTYRCNSKEFSLIGNLSIFCTNKGAWSGPAPACKVVRCPNPDVSNSERKSGFGSSFTYKDSIRFECLAGFTLNGTSKVECGADNEWDPRLPVCQPVTCREPPDLVNGTHSGKGQEVFQYKERVIYQCNSDKYKLLGNPSVHCTEDGLWSRPVPTCEVLVILCKNPSVPNGKITQGERSFYSVHHQVMFKCNVGFIMVGDSLVQCGEDEEWHPHLPVCQSVTCESPPGLIDGTHNGTGHYEVGTIIIYICNFDKSTLHGDTSIRCRHNGTWSGQAPTCKASASCESPPDLVHGTHNGTHRSEVGTVIVYVCIYDESIRSSIHCKEDGSWSGSLPTCPGPSIPVWVIVLIVFVILLVIGLLALYFCKTKSKHQGDYTTNETRNAGHEAMPLSA